MPDPIPDPLWDMMLSTNDCYPGCACAQDYFEITVDRLKQWTQQQPMEILKRVGQQIGEVEQLHPDRISDASKQTNIAFGPAAPFADWIQSWRQCFEASTASANKAGERDGRSSGA